MNERHYVDIEAINRWLAALALILGIVNTISIWMRHGTGKIEGIMTDLKTHDRRIQSLEGDQRHLPTKEDLHELTLAVAAFEGRLEAQGATLESLARTVRRIDDHLRTQK